MVEILDRRGVELGEYEFDDLFDLAIPDDENPTPPIAPVPFAVAEQEPEVFEPNLTPFGRLDQPVGIIVPNAQMVVSQRSFGTQPFGFGLFGGVEPFSEEITILEALQ